MTQELKQQLLDNVMNITFTKKDGTQRVMKATLREDIIPAPTKEDPLTQKKVRAISEEVLPCWDVENEGWRSFRIDSIISAEISK